MNPEPIPPLESTSAEPNKWPSVDANGTDAGELGGQGAGPQPRRQCAWGNQLAGIGETPCTRLYGPDGEQVRVTIGTPFAVGKFEVSFTEWDACVTDKGCAYEPGAS
jgi:hypothetical protein